MLDCPPGPLNSLNVVERGTNLAVEPLGAHQAAKSPVRGVDRGVHGGVDLGDGEGTGQCGAEVMRAFIGPPPR